MSDNEDKILTTEDVAAKFQVAPGTVSNWVGGTKPDFPKGFKLGTGRNSPRRWRESVIDEYIAGFRASDSIENKLKIPDHIDREWLRGWHSSGSICKRLFARSGKKRTASFIIEFTSRNGGPMECKAVPTNEGQYPFKYLYQPLQIIKVFHIKKIPYDFGSERRLSLVDEIELLEKKRKELKRRIRLSDHEDHRFKSKPAANCSQLYPLGKPLDHSQVMELSGAVPESMSGVYFLISNDEIVYVGKSKNMLNRVQEHMANPEKVFNRFTFFPTHLSSALAVESYYISLFRPRFNIVAGISLDRILDEVSDK